MTPTYFSPQNRVVRANNDFLGRNRLVFWFIGCIVSFAGSMGLFNALPSFGWAVTTGIGIASIYTSRLLLPLTVVMIFNLLFNLYAIPFIFFDVDLVTLPREVALPYLTQVLWIIALFVAVLMLWISSIKKNKQSQASFVVMAQNLRISRLPTVFYGFIAVLLIATQFGISGSMVLGKADGYSDYVENLQNASGLQEYLLVVFFVAALLMQTRLQRFIWYLVLTFFVVKLSLVGLRIVALMGVLAGLWFSNFKFSLRRIFFVFVIGFLVFSFLGLLKEGLPTGDEALTAIFFESQGGRLVSHHSNVLWASTVMLKLIDGNVIDLTRRAEAFVYYFFNTIIPSGILQRAFGQGYLGSWLQDSGYTSGGGHIAVYAYVVGAAPGVVLVASLIGIALRIAVSNSIGLCAQFARCWLMMTMITFPRWVSYDMGNFLFRLPIYAVIIYSLIFLIRHSAPTKR